MYVIISLQMFGHSLFAGREIHSSFWQWCNSLFTIRRDLGHNAALLVTPFHSCILHCTLSEIRHILVHFKNLNLITDSLGELIIKLYCCKSGITGI